MILTGTVNTSGAVNITFPTAFASPPMVTANETVGYGHLVTSRAITATGFTANSWDLNGVLVNSNIKWNAIGVIS